MENIKKIQERLLEMAKEIRNVLENHKIPYFITYGTLLGAVRHKGFIPWDDDFDFYLFSDSYKQAIDALKKELSADLFIEDKDTEPRYFHGWAHVKDLNSVTEYNLPSQDNSYLHRGICVDLFKTTKIKESREKAFRLTEHISYLKRRNEACLIDKDECHIRLTRLSKELDKENEKICKVDDLSESNIWAFPSIYNDRLYEDEMFPLKKYKFEDTEFYGPNDATALLKRCYGDYMTLPPVGKRQSHYSNVQFYDKKEK